MNRIILSLLIFCGIQNLNAQALSETMKTYRNACLKMLEGIDHNFDKYLLWDAIDLYNKVKITEFSEQDFTPVDTLTIYNEVNPKFYFIPEYADSLIRYGSLVEIDNISILRKGEDYDVQILHKGIKANSSVAYKSVGQNDCEMIVIGESGANVKLTIENVSTGASYVGLAENNGQLSYVIWHLPSEGSEFIFKVDNLSDKDVTIVIAVN